jgi:hypothetical protein
MKWLVVGFALAVGCSSPKSSARPENVTATRETSFQGVYLEGLKGERASPTGVFLPADEWRALSADEADTHSVTLTNRPVRRGSTFGVRRLPRLSHPRALLTPEKAWIRKPADLKTVEQTRQLYWRRLEEAKQRYPNSQGFENHHAIPLYLGGTARGTTYRLPSAYHKALTQEFRREWAYGQGRPDPKQLMDILARVYSRYPLPQLVGLQP